MKTQTQFNIATKFEKKMQNQKRITYTASET